jgi:hypothetical protein
MTDQVVTARAAGGSTVTVRTDRNGRFTILLRSGHYTIAPGCGASTPLAVPAATSALLKLQCDFP